MRNVWNKIRSVNQKFLGIVFLSGFMLFIVCLMFREGIEHSAPAAVSSSGGSNENSNQHHDMSCQVLPRDKNHPFVIYVGWVHNLQWDPDGKVQYSVLTNPGPNDWRSYDPRTGPVTTPAASWLTLVGDEPNRDVKVEYELVQK
jgi:hypothetical protein